MRSYIYLCCVLFFPFSVLSQTMDWCGTTSGGGQLAGTASSLQMTNDYEVRIYLHVVQKSDGSMGVPVAEMYDMVDTLNHDFSPYGICFTVEELDFINDDDFVEDWNDDCLLGAAIDNDDDNDFQELTNTSSHTNGIDIYVFPDAKGFVGGISLGIPGTAILLGGSFANAGPPVQNLLLRESHAVTHEIGHAFGLYHPYNGTQERPPRLNCGTLNCTGYCSELVNGTSENRAGCGDFVADTPADPQLNPFDSLNGQGTFVYSSSGCYWDTTLLTETDENNDLYIPSANDYMANIFDACRNTFTSGQVERMKGFLATSPVLSPTIISINSCNAPPSRVASSSYIPIFHGAERLTADFHFEGTNVYTWSVTGDTLIADKQYMVLVGESYTGLIDGLFRPIIYENVPTTHYVREDTLQGKVWVYNTFLQEERLLYDFSLNIGDFYPGWEDYVLYKIDTVPTPVGASKRFRFRSEKNPKREITWIEGVGNPLPYDPTSVRNARLLENGEWDMPYALLCMSRNGQLVYNEGAVKAGVTTPCGELVTVPTKQVQVLDPQLQVFPNPTHSILTLLSAKLVSERLQIRILDSTGRIWQQFIKPPGQELFEMEVTALPNGMYSIQIWQEQKGMQVERFVKQGG